MPFHGLQGRTQWAVYWLAIGFDRYGQPTTSNIAQEVRVRWDDTQRTVLLPDGSPRGIDATICGLPFDVPLGTLFWKGRINDLVSTGTSQIPSTDVMRVVTFNGTPDIRGRNSYRETTLMRTKDVLGNTVAG